MDNNMLNEVQVVDTAIDTIKSETRTAGVKGLAAGAALVGGIWLGAHLYKKFKKPKRVEVGPEAQTKSDNVVH